MLDIGMPRLFTSLLALALCISSFESNASNIQFPKLTGRVVDTANMLSPSVERELSAIFAAHENQTTNQVVVVTVKNWGGISKEKYGITLARKWGIGQEGKDNGIVLAISEGNREIRMEVGYGLERTMTDVIAMQIIRKIIVPEFKKGNFDEGVTMGSIAIIEVLSGAEVSIDGYKKPNKANVLAALFACSVIFLCIGIGVLHEQYLRRKWENEYPGIPFRKNSDGTLYTGSDYSGFGGGGGGFGGGGGGGSW